MGNEQRTNAINQHERKAVPGYNPDRPWHHVMRVVLDDTGYWEAKVHRPLLGASKSQWVALGSVSEDAAPRL